MCAVNQIEELSALQRSDKLHDTHGIFLKNMTSDRADTQSTVGSLITSSIRACSCTPRLTKVEHARPRLFTFSLGGVQFS